MFLFVQKLWLCETMAPYDGLEIRAMARPALPETDRKSTRLVIRLSPAERLQIEQAAHKAGMSTSSYVRDQALKGRVNVHEPRPLHPALFEQIRRIGVNLNQLTKLAHETGELPAALESACQSVESILLREISAVPEPEPAPEDDAFSGTVFQTFSPEDEPDK